MHAALPYLCPSNYPTLATPLLPLGNFLALCTAVCIDLAKSEQESCAHEYNYVQGFLFRLNGGLTT